MGECENGRMGEGARAADLFTQAVDIMAHLRSADGCPWDRKQTRETLKRCLLEEVYEVLDAVDSGSPEAFCSELGDLLMMILFYAQLAREAGEFDIRDVIRTLVEKLVRRHPHVFGDAFAETPAQVVHQWEAIKHQDRAENGMHSILDDLPRAFPALMLAAKVQKRAAQVGFDWDRPEGALEKLEEEIAEVRQAVTEEPAERVAMEIGDLLFAMVNVARLLRVDPEEALRTTIREFERRFRAIESAAHAQSRPLPSLTLAEMDAIWESAKR